MELRYLNAICKNKQLHKFHVKWFWIRNPNQQHRCRRAETISTPNFLVARSVGPQKSYESSQDGAPQL